MEAKVDWKVKENGFAHHTDLYQSSEMVLRRGMPFEIVVSFSRNAPDPKSLIVTVETGSTPAMNEKTRISFALSGSGGGGSQWSGRAARASPGSLSLTISVTSPADAMIGRYRMGLKDGQRSYFLGTLIILFNPWNQADEVFMPDEIERREYILSQAGLLFVGSARSINTRGWDYGQFKGQILATCLTILDRSINHRKDPHTDLRRRNDPKYVGRVLSAMVNSNDDNGVLQGNWTGNYSGGSNPSSWTGSVDILQKWKDSGFRPVRYGQCWVFAGVLNTALRSLGIPARVVTNFNSAHDTDKSLTIDEHYDSAGNPVNLVSDSIWNFHVWNEGWFARSDLGPAYNGWQVLDATPQERSTGIFQCGPASVTSIKEGDVDLDYDCPFVFSEVNADRVTWSVDSSTGQKKKLYSESKTIGQYTSTKAVGSFARLDITHNYKYPEGSAKEREVFNKARGKLNLNTLDATSAHVAAAKKPDVAGKFEQEGAAQVGKGVELRLRLKSQASAPRTLTANMKAWAILYTGKPIHEVWGSSVPVTLGPQEEKVIPIKISYGEYKKHLTPDNMIRVTAVCHVEGSGTALVEHDVVLSNPSIAIKVLGPAKVGQEVKVEVTFTNPLDEEVTDCALHADGELLESKLKIDVQPVKAKQTSRFQFGITPTKSGARQLVVVFTCNRFKDINSFEVVNVVD